MAHLIIEDPRNPPDGTIGGLPLASPGTKWPICRSCGGPMQFLAQLPLRGVGLSSKTLEDTVLLLFQCQNDPGMCDEWDPDSGGNAALLTATEGRQPLEVPAGPTRLPRESKVRLVPYDEGVAGETPDDNYCKAIDANALTLGKLGSVPLWMQGDETPSCQCGSRMTFVAQLEARGGGGMNFGDSGAGYAFVCGSCAEQAKFLWQSA